MLKELKKYLPENILFYNEPLKLHSTFRIGGPADLLVTPSDDDQLIVLFDFINKNNIKYIVIGNGSNILFSDLGFRGIVIKMCSNYSGIFFENSDDDKVMLKAKSGTLLSKLSYYAYYHHPNTESGHPDTPPENLPEQTRVQQMDIGGHRADEKTK